MNRFENLFKGLTANQSYEILKKMSLAVENKNRQELYRAYFNSLKNNIKK